jgi:methylisocitrate lyase
MMLRCWALGIRHWKIISILITNYPLPITNYQPTRQYKYSSEHDIMIIPGVYDCLGAKLVEKLGFNVVATSGFGIAASTLGLPDYGFLTAT